MAKFRVELNNEVCQGFGACVELCPDSFYMSEEGKARFKGGERIAEGGNVKDMIEVTKLGCYGQAEATCPFNAISVTKIG